MIRLALPTINLNATGQSPFQENAMSNNSEKVIAVFGATGHQGGGVVRALQTRGQFKVRS